jgi:hypothetical protein
MFKAFFLEQPFLFIKQEGKSNQTVQEMAYLDYGICPRKPPREIKKEKKLVRFSRDSRPEAVDRSIPL